VKESDLGLDGVGQISHYVLAKSKKYMQNSVSKSPVFDSNTVR